LADLSQIQRQHFLLSILANTKSGYTAKDLLHYATGAGYDVSSRTISRDIDDLSRSFPVYEEKCKGEICYFLADRLEGLVEFNLDELITLYYLKEIAEAHASSDLATSSVYLINKLLSKLSTDKFTLINTFKDAIRVDPEIANSKNTLDVTMLQKIRSAVANQSPIEICYSAFNTGETTTRRVDPYFLELSEGCYKIVGFCYLRNEFRAFNVSRIISMKVEDGKFEKPENFYEEYVEGRFDKLASGNKTTLKFCLWGQAARLVKEYESKRADKITDKPDGKIIFEKNAAVTHDVLMWVLSYGDEIEVIEPLELKEQVINAAKGILKNYKT